MGENQILKSIRHVFIVNMRSSFQDRRNLYLVMPNFKGGDLRYHLIQKRIFTEEQTKFFVACIILGLEYIHSNNIIHRDIKPENLIFDESGFLYITDFGIAKYWRPENSKDSSGTPGYMAPEVMSKKNHSFSVDFYALGIIIYESIMGRRPYQGRNRREIQQ